MQWSDVLFGTVLGLLPAVLSRWAAQRYAMYLAKLGYNKAIVSLAALGVVLFVGFTGISGVIGLYSWVFGSEEPLWAHSGAIAGIVLPFTLVWISIVFAVVRYQSSYFVDYYFPQYWLICGVPALTFTVAGVIFVQLGLVDTVAEGLALRFKFPQFCRVVSDSDSCYRGFYMDNLGHYKPVPPKICRSLERHHALDCTIHNHPIYPDTATCKWIRNRKKSSTALYYWCLSHLPPGAERRDACKRAEASFRWVDVFFGDCVTRDNIYEEVSSSKSVAMHFLDFHENLNNAGYRKRFDIPEGLGPKLDFAKILSLDAQLERTDREGRTLLFYVHDPRDLEALLKRKIRINLLDENGLSAPMHWISRAQPERYGPLIERLVAAGYPIDLVDTQRGRTLLTQYIISLRGRPEEERESDQVVEFVKLLLRLKASPHARDRAKKKVSEHVAQLKLKRIGEIVR